MVKYLSDLCKKKKKCGCFKDAVDRISVKKPHEPSDFNWRNMIEESWKKYLWRGFTILLLFAIVGITCLIIYRIRIYQNVESQLIAKLYQERNITTKALLQPESWKE